MSPVISNLIHALPDLFHFAAGSIDLKILEWVLKGLLEMFVGNVFDPCVLTA